MLRICKNVIPQELHDLDQHFVFRNKNFKIFSLKYSQIKIIIENIFLFFFNICI